MCFRQRKAKEGALLWLGEEGFPSAAEQDKAFQEGMDKEAMMRRVMEKWKRLSVEEKAVWRKRAEEGANINKK